MIPFTLPKIKNIIFVEKPKMAENMFVCYFNVTFLQKKVKIKSADFPNNEVKWKTFVDCKITTLISFPV